MALDAKKRMEMEAAWVDAIHRLNQFRVGQIQENTGVEYLAVRADLIGDEFLLCGDSGNAAAYPFRMNAVAARQLARSILKQAADLFPEDRIEDKRKPPAALN